MMKFPLLLCFLVVSFLMIDAEEAREAEATDGDGTQDTGFKSFSLKPELLQAIAASGLVNPSEIQRKLLPKAILGRDIICQARTGAGKTATYALATLQQLTPVDGQVSVLVLTNTMEVAFQIKNEYQRLSKYLTSAKVAVFSRYQRIKKDKEVLKTNVPHIVIGTPGRILALVKAKTLNLNHVKHFILDEAEKIMERTDRRRDVQEIFRTTPHEKQVMMFSAVLKREMRARCKKFTQDPIEEYVEYDPKYLAKLTQHYVELKDSGKTRKLLKLLDSFEYKRVIIFVKSVQRCAALSMLLAEHHFPTVTIDRSISNAERLSAAKKFKNNEVRILVTTTLFGRGMEGYGRVNIIVNYDMPEDSDTYFSRIDRAGLLDNKGLVISFASSEKDKEVLKDDRFVVTDLPDTIDVSTYI